MDNGHFAINIKVVLQSFLQLSKILINTYCTFIEYKHM
jgi:hypothetical protein